MHTKNKVESPQDLKKAFQLMGLDTYSDEAYEIIFKEFKANEEEEDWWENKGSSCTYPHYDLEIFPESITQDYLEMTKNEFANYPRPDRDFINFTWVLTNGNYLVRVDN